MPTPFRRFRSRERRWAANDSSIFLIEPKSAVSIAIRFLGILGLFGGMRVSKKDEMNDFICAVFGFVFALGAGFFGVAFFAINYSLLVNLCFKLPRFLQKYKTKKGYFYHATTIF